MSNWADKKALDLLFDMDCDWTHDGQSPGILQEEEARILIAQALRDVAAEKDKEIERLRRENNSLRGQPND